MRHRWGPGLSTARFATVVIHLGITQPVTIYCYEGGENAPDGYYRHGESGHELHLNVAQNPRNLSRTIWHELTHAMQCELDFRGDGPSFHQDAFAEAITAGIAGYPGPLEAEARSFEDLDWDLRLVRMTRR